MGITTFTRTCPICGSEYEADLSELNRGWAQTCSRSCSAKRQRALKAVPTDSQLLPCSGVTDGQVRETVTLAPNMRAAAKRLGVSEDHLRRVAAQHGIKGNGRRSRRRCISEDDIVKLANEGYTRPDVAHLLGISPAYLKDLIAKWDLASEFVVSKGRAAAITKNGYAWAAGRNS